MWYKAMLCTQFLFKDFSGLWLKHFEDPLIKQSLSKNVIILSQKCIIRNMVITLLKQNL